ncbi:MAG TPA: phosphatase PAP2 family protein [Bacteroidia bacterium]|nr:phosphatase PAP2 family protein [Bacteroidia bacterium]
MSHKHLISLLLIFSAGLLPAQNLDFRILKSINQYEYPKWDQAMRLTSESVNYSWSLVIIAPGVQGLVNKDAVMLRNSAKSAISIGLAGLISSSLKLSIKRPRPAVQYPNDIIARDEAGPYSFPSGHTTFAFASATALSLTYPKWYVVLPSYLYAGLVGYSRMRLGMHFPSDVLAGMVIGIGSGLLTWKLDKALYGK